MAANHDPAFMPYAEPLIPATLVQRYKRFLVDVELAPGELTTAHTPNTGSMQGCSDPGSPVYLRRAANPGRKYPLSLELVDAGPSLVGVDTLAPNRLLYQAARGGLPAELAGYHSVRREVRVGERSRVDLLLEQPDRRPCYVEIKNVTLAQQGAARFPDAVTTRGRRHLEELAQLARLGMRAVILFAVQRNDCGSMEPADDIDAEYGQTLRRVVAGGVEALAYHLEVSLEGIRLGRRLPVELEAGAR